MTDFIFDYTELYLATEYTDGDLTLDLYAKDDKYKLTDQKTSALLTQFYASILNRDTSSIFMGVKIGNVVENGTWQGKTRYTATLALSDSSNPMVGLANTYDGTNANANIIAGNKLSSLPADSKVLCSIGSGVLRNLSTLFVEGTAELTVTAGEAITGTILSPLPIMLSTVDDKAYLYDGTYPYAGLITETVDADEEFSLKMNGAKIVGVTSVTTGLVYATTAGALTNTQSTTTKFAGQMVDGTMQVIVTDNVTITELSEAQAEDDSSTVFGTVSGERLAQAIAANPANLPTTTQGDIIVRGATTDERLAIGTTGQVLTSNGTTAGWVDGDIVAGEAFEDILTGQALYGFKATTSISQFTGANLSSISTQIVGQTFLAPAPGSIINAVEKIDVHTKGSGTAYSVKIELYESDKTTLIGTSRTVSFGGANDNFDSFWFDIPPKIDNNQSLYFKIILVSGSGVQTKYATGNTYTDGAMFIDGVEQSGNDLMFNISATGHGYYLTDADVVAKTKFIGFAQNDAATGENVLVKANGIDGNNNPEISAPNTTLYLSNTPGGVSTSAGTNSVKVAKVIDATHRIIIQPPL